ncbi:hypothetical protein ACFQ0T_24220 [Kitasatospora gansuensis]
MDAALAAARVDADLAVGHRHGDQVGDGLAGRPVEVGGGGPLGAVREDGEVARSGGLGGRHVQRHRGGVGRDALDARDREVEDLARLQRGATAVPGVEYPSRAGRGEGGAVLAVIALQVRDELHAAGVPGGAADVEPDRVVGHRHGDQVGDRGARRPVQVGDTGGVGAVRMDRQVPGGGRVGHRDVHGDGLGTLELGGQLQVYVPACADRTRVAADVGAGVQQPPGRERGVEAAELPELVRTAIAEARAGTGVGDERVVHGGNPPPSTGSMPGAFSSAESMTGLTGRPLYGTAGSATKSCVPWPVAEVKPACVV